MANKNRCSKASLVLFFFIALGDPGKAGKKTWTVQVAPVKSMNYRWLGGGNSNILNVHPENLGKMNPFWRAYFSRGWEKIHQLGNYQCFHKKTNLTAIYTHCILRRIESLNHRHTETAISVPGVFLLWTLETIETVYSLILSLEPIHQTITPFKILASNESIGIGSIYGI